MDYEKIFSRQERVHFIGVGGISMRQLALYCRDRGARVSGSDCAECDGIRFLREQSIDCQVGHQPKLVCDADLVVASSAIAKDNPEIQYAKLHGIEIVDRASVLRMVCQDFEKVIAVAGSHGKTTTATMIYSILRAAGVKVSAHIGGVTDANICYGDEYLVVEACEYKRSFLSIKPYLAVITNIESDHLDYYKDLADIKQAFLQFTSQSQRVLLGDEKTTSFLHGEDIPMTVQDVSFDTNEYKTSFCLIDDECTPLYMSALGRYNVDNALIACRAAKALGLNKQAMVNGLASFVMPRRRMEKLGQFNGADVILDYAHHPTQIASFNEQIEKVYHDYIMIFQPHTFSRTKTLLPDFIKAFKGVPRLIIYKEYSARENISQGISAKQLKDILCHNKIKCTYFDNLNKLKNHLQKYDVDAYLFVGAGDLGEKVVDLLK